MNKNKYKIITILASIMFVLLIAMTTCTLFLFPSSAYAVNPSVCWGCEDWGNGFYECGMGYWGYTGCTHFSGYCVTYGSSCNLE